MTYLWRSSYDVMQADKCYVTSQTSVQVGLGFSALTLGGVSASHLDVAPRHAGVIFGAGNTAATLAGLLSVPFTGYLLQVSPQRNLDPLASSCLLFRFPLAHDLCLVSSEVCERTAASMGEGL